MVACSSADRFCIRAMQIGGRESWIWSHCRSSMMKGTCRDLTSARRRSTPRSATNRMIWRKLAGPTPMSWFPARTTNTDVRKNAMAPKPATRAWSHPAASESGTCPKFNLKMWVRNRANSDARTLNPT
jgi:hypothetical protein